MKESFVMAFKINEISNLLWQLGSIALALSWSVDATCHRIFVENYVLFF